MFRKLSAIRMPDAENVHCLWRESVTSHGMNESAEATQAEKDEQRRKRTAKQGAERREQGEIAEQSRLLASACCHSIHFGFSSVID